MAWPDRGYTGFISKMNISTLISFLGHSSIHAPFDAFLKANGVKRRPRDTDGYPYAIKSAVPGLSLGFEDDPEDLGIPRKSDGGFVFSKINFELVSKKAPYLGDLPFGVDQRRSGQEVSALLGAPRTQGKVPVGDGVGMSYFIDGLVVVFSYADASLIQLSYVGISLPDDADREHGLAPA
ncbi:hypothetical protein ACQ86G_22755 [Roseateles chitinivorans]|uniref:hypothetical protein n=1 Tax=Roseateles chitinivorans TaxID=2917965 RepID=UPI003D67D070